MSLKRSFLEPRSYTSYGDSKCEWQSDAPLATQVLSFLDEQQKSQRGGSAYPPSSHLDSKSHPVVEIMPADVAKRHTLSWRGLTVEAVQVTNRAKVRLHFRASVHLLVAYEDGERQAGETTVAGLPRSTLRQVARKLTFVPAGTEFRDDHDPRTPTRLFLVYFDQEQLSESFDLDLPNGALQPRIFFDDATLWSTVFKLKRLLESRAERDQLYAGALGVVLLHELARLNTGIRNIDMPARGGLAPWQQRAVASYIDEHLSEQIKLATLAKLARLSPYYFCRAFKKSFGMSPHRYLNSRRIQQAKALLVEQGATVTTTGLTLGFSETSSFSAAFRRETGLTPTEYRRAFG